MAESNGEQCPNVQIVGKGSPFEVEAALRCTIVRENADALGASVRARRRQLGLTQHDVALLAGCADRFVHTLEQGKATLRLDKVLDVLEVLGLGLRVEPGPPGVHTAESG